MNQVKDAIFEALISRTRAVLTEGRSVLIVGNLKNSTKVELLRGLSSRQIYFADAFTKNRSPSVGLVLMVRWIAHSASDKLRSILHPTVIPNGELKRIFLRCQDLLVNVRPAGSSLSGPPTEGVSLINESTRTPAEIDSPSLVLENLISLSSEFQPTTKENVVMSEPKAPDVKDFAVAIIARCKESPDGEVTSYELVKLREKFGIESTTAKLTRNGWILPQTKEGCSKASAYKPGDAMRSAASAIAEIQPVNSATPWTALIAEEPGLIVRSAQLQEELDAVTANLARIAEAKSLVAKLEELMK